MLEAADLAPQLGARQSLVAVDAERKGCVSDEQIRHDPTPSVDHPPVAQSDAAVKTLQAASIVAAAIQSASSTAIWGTPLTWIGDDRQAPGDLLDRRSSRSASPKSSPTGPRSSAITSVPCASSPGLAGQRLARAPRRGCRAARPARRRRPAARPRSRRSRSSSASAGSPRLLKAPSLEAVQRELLDRGAGAVGVEADLAEEDAVGPGDRPFAEVDRVRAVEAVGEVAQAAADRLGAAAGAAVDGDRGDPEAGELGGDVGRHPALLGRRLPADARSSAAGPISAPPRLRRLGRASSASTLAPSWPAVSSPMLALCRVPPG